jgi:hypothetical protein
MESAGVLESIAEVAIALAGFGGIAAGLGYRARGTWSRDDQLRLMLLAWAGLSVVFACFIPHVAHHLGSTTTWRTTSVLFFLILLATLLYQLWFSRMWEGLPAEYSRIAALLTFTAQIVALILLSFAALGYAEAREFGFYLAAVLLTLFQASLYFVRLLATSFRRSEPAA